MLGSWCLKWIDLGNFFFVDSLHISICLESTYLFILKMCYSLFVSEKNLKIWKYEKKYNKKSKVLKSYT